METTTKKQPTTTAVSTTPKEKAITDMVLARVNTFVDAGELTLPKDYCPGNALKAAFLVLQETVDKDRKPVLQSCTQVSIANALLNMVVSGLSVFKHQGVFVARGNKLSFERQYFGNILLAKRSGGLLADPVANVVYEGENFVVNVNSMTGDFTIVKHDIDITKWKADKIVGAYCVLRTKDGIKTTIMTIDEIHAAWNQSPTHGSSPAHKNFPGEMCKKTVINRACKTLINASSDGYLFGSVPDADEPDTSTYEDAKSQRDAANALSAPATTIDPDVFNAAHEADYEEVPDESENAPDEVAPANDAEADDDEPSY